MAIHRWPSAPFKPFPSLCSAEVLSENGRLPLTGDVIKAYNMMMGAHRGEVICSVTTAQVSQRVSARYTVWYCVITPTLTIWDSRDVYI